MDWKKEWKAAAAIIGIFIVAYYLPVGHPRFNRAVFEALYLLKEYAQLHVILCLIPAFFIAGAIGVFVSQAAVMKYLGAHAKKIISYSVASVSGSVLAVCSCTILPLFAGIYKMGAGIGPATAFLYSGPAINILAIILTARILGLSIGIARAVGAVAFSIIIGLLMHFIFRKEEREKAEAAMVMPSEEAIRPMWQNILYFAIMIGILVTGTWGGCACSESISETKYFIKGILLSIFTLSLGVILIVWFKVKFWKVLSTAIITALSVFAFPDRTLIHFSVAIIGLSWITSTSEGEASDWFSSTFQFAKQILPLLFIGVLIAGLLLGRPGQEGIIPPNWVSIAVGGNSIRANLFASIVGAFMYFATLTEVPILQGLIGNGMGKGPALALLLAGPALSLPNMLVIRSVIGTKKTIVFVALVVIMATLSGIIYGAFF